MRLVEQHCISKQDPRYSLIDAACFASKNLYNYANYIVRQSFIHEHIYKGYAMVYHEVKGHECYKALPAKIANDVLRLLDKNWKSFFKAIKAYSQDPTPFVGKPCLPTYKDKQKGRNILIYDIQAINKKGLRKGLIQPSMLDIEVQTKQTNVAQVRIIPRCGFYMVEVVYDKDPVPAPNVNPALIASVDIGVNNLGALTANKSGFVPRLVNGRPIKSVNQFYNKRRTELQSLVKKSHFTHRMECATMKRTRCIDHFLHTASRRIIDLLVQEGIGTLVIGKNPLWKQDPTMRRKKDEPIFLGKRVKRGLYQSRHGKRFNADVNGSYNILRKVSPNAFEQGSRGYAVHPVRLYA
ncbi:MAG: hypothetical protein PVSMB2_05150 [Ktedonobacteraceae bacterium]